jgi:hypothetical protein
MKKMSSQMAEMQKKLADMPPEQRAMIEKMMGSKGKEDAPTTVTPTSEKRTISGYACQKYTLDRDGKTVITVWATKEITAFEGMRKDWSQLQKRLMALTPGGAKSIAEAFTKIQGFPVQTEMEQGITNVVTKFEKRTTPAGDFEVPSGYTKVKNKAMNDGGSEE